MAKFSQFWVSEQQQLGFKKNMVVHNMCTFMVKEAAKCFLENGHNVLFGCCLDLSKAYDKVSHPLLLQSCCNKVCPTFS